MPSPIVAEFAVLEDRKEGRKQGYLCEEQWRNVIYTVIHNIYIYIVCSLTCHSDYSCNAT